MRYLFIFINLCLQGLFPQLNSTGFGLPTQVDVKESISKSATELLLTQLFITANQKLQKFSNLLATEIDGLEIIGTLAVLQQYMNDNLNVTIQQPEPTITHTLEDKRIDIDLDMEKDEIIDSSKDINKECSSKIEEHSVHLVVMLSELRTDLLEKLKIYMADQIAWILSQKSDPKKAGVLVPISKFPSLVRQVLEMSGGQVIKFSCYLLRYFIILCLDVFILFDCYEHLCDYDK